ncbi:HIT domain-containing protein [Thermoproteota archaeon]
MAQQLTEEDLKNMSPEELRELQKQNCIFCQIISGKVQSKKVYEDERVLAILDINPANPGHILLLPKEHHALMPMVPDEEQKYLFMIAKQLSHVLLKALKVSGTNIFLANGAVAGQRAPHVMIHVIPRKENDGVTVFDLPRHPIREEDLKKLQLILRKSMSQMMKVDDKELEEEIKALEKPAEAKPAPAEEVKEAPPAEKEPEEPQEEVEEEKPEPEEHTGCG